MTPFIEQLTRTELYPHPADSVEVIETHISWILLAGDYVYKIKKPVTLPFVDFSGLAARRYFCHQELELNRRLAPEIYLEVIAITGDTRNPVLGGEGEAIEYAVKMRRFEQDQLFHRLLAAGELTVGHMRELAERIAGFHDHLPAAGPDSAQGEPDDVMQPALDNFREMAEQSVPTRRKELDALHDWTRRRCAELEAFFARRKQQGFVRECHGDLHLGNIALVDGRPVAFDCMEFSEDLRWIDVMNEVAFVVMDCIDRGRGDLGFHFLDTWLQHHGDYEGVALLRFYMVYRALVRAKVQGLQAGQASAEGEDADALVQAADGYVELAQQLLDSGQPALLVMHGFSASGKSRLAGELVGQLGAVRLRSDVERKRLFELDPDSDSGSGINQGIYERGASERTYDHLVQQADQVLTAGFPVIIDAACLKHWQRARFTELARTRDVTLRFVDCAASPATLRERIRARRARGGDPSEADERVLDHQLDSHDPFTADESPHVLRCDMEGNDEAATLAAGASRVAASLDGH